jgi:DHA2 family multidrug resistance protein
MPFSDSTPELEVIAEAPAAVPAAPATPAPTSEPWKPRFNPWAIALTVTLATFMEVLDTSIANVSLPHIAGGLSASFDESTWILTSYLVSNAVVLPISGWLSDRIGRKRFYMSCVALFTVSSFLCGLAPSLPLLVFFRVLQGIGGGGLAPSEQAILADTFEPQKRGMAFAVYGMAVVLAPAIGPTLGGYITDHYSWRWIFYLNVPVGILSLLLTQRMVEDPPHLVAARQRAKGAPIDFVGFALIAIGLSTLQVVLDKGQEDDWFGSHFIVTFAIIAAITLVTFLIWEWRHEHPIVNLRLFKLRTFAVSATLMFVLGLALYGTTVLIPQFLQELMGWTAETSGFVLTPGAFAIILLLPLVGYLVSRVDARYLIAFGFVSVGGAMLYMSKIYLGIDLHTAIMFRVYQCLGLAFLFIPINTVSYNGVALEDNNQVSGIMNLMRNLGGAVGISGVTTMISRFTQAHHNFLAAHVNAANPIYREYVAGISGALSHTSIGSVAGQQAALAAIAMQVRRQSQALAYVDTIWYLGVLCLLLIPLVFIMKKAKPGKASMGH